MTNVRTEFVAVEYRDIDEPLTERQFAYGPATIVDELEEEGNWVEELHRGDHLGIAERVARSHWGGYELDGAGGHQRLLWHLVPRGDVDLLSYLAPEHLRAKVRYKSFRTAWTADILRRWSESALHRITRADTLAVIAALGSALDNPMTGREAQQIVDSVLEARLNESMAALMQRK
ncbi:hypothetical protein [Mycobacteroides abscessus]|uniref:hypothetical protein n=1 Tax=Mycobacteroides abscessus TaxID=36809 RepID=UPI000C25A38F|nr:hypothetical protein [Mycobacteroides abscessus]